MFQHQKKSESPYKRLNVEPDNFEENLDLETSEGKKKRKIKSKLPSVKLKRFNSQKSLTTVSDESASSRSQNTKKVFKKSLSKSKGLTLSPVKEEKVASVKVSRFKTKSFKKKPGKREFNQAMKRLRYVVFLKFLIKMFIASPKP